MSTPTETKPMPKRGESGRKVASEARSEAKPSGVNKEDSSSRASRGDAARSEAKSSKPSEVNKEDRGRVSRSAQREHEPRLLNVGYGNVITRHRVVAVVSSQSSASRRLRDDAEQRGLLVDATQGRRTRSMLVMDSGHIVMSAVNPETIAARIESGEEGLV